MLTYFSISHVNRPSRFFLMLLPLYMLSSAPAFARDDDGHDHIRGFLKGMASFYASKFHGRKTASGQIYNQNDFTCAHRTLPFGTPILVKNPATGIECTVVVNDRGPYRSNRALDLSRAAARKLGITGVGRILYRTGHYVASKIDRHDNKAQLAAVHEPVDEEE